MALNGIEYDQCGQPTADATRLDCSSRSEGWKPGSTKTGIFPTGGYSQADGTETEVELLYPARARPASLVLLKYIGVGKNLRRHARYKEEGELAKVAIKSEARGESQRADYREVEIAWVVAAPVDRN
jgi:hypothetical protein